LQPQGMVKVRLNNFKRERTPEKRVPKTTASEKGLRRSKSKLASSDGRRDGNQGGGRAPRRESNLNQFPEQGKTLGSGLKGRAEERKDSWKKSSRKKKKTPHAFNQQTLER